MFFNGKIAHYYQLSYFQINPVYLFTIKSCRNDFNYDYEVQSLRPRYTEQFHCLNEADPIKWSITIRQFVKPGALAVIFYSLAHSNQIFKFRNHQFVSLFLSFVEHSINELEKNKRNLNNSAKCK